LLLAAHLILVIVVPSPLFIVHQKLKTSVMKKTVNPVWNEDLTLAVMDASAPIKLVSIDRSIICIIVTLLQFTVSDSCMYRRFSTRTRSARTT